MNKSFGFIKTHCILCKFSIIIRIIDARTTPSKGAIWDEFGEQHQQSIKSTIFMPN
jgi:hypothetical protein